MANIIDYTRNVAKSITYSAVDKIKDMNPVLEDLASSNQDLTKTLYASIKDYKGTMKRAKDWVIKSDVYEAADVGLHAVVEDIRSGKFYNRERMDELETKAGGEMTNGWGDFSDDPFKEIDNSEDGNFSFDDDSDNQVSADTMAIHDSIDNTGDKITNGVAMATARSAEGIAATNIKIAQKNQKHSEMLANKISANMGAINSTVAELIRFNTEQQKPYIDKSIQFYNDVMGAHKETNELLKEIIKNQQQMITPPDEKSKREDLGWKAIGEVPDLSVYGQRIMKNVKDMSGGILDMFDSSQTGMGNLLLDFVSSPLKAIPDAIVKTVIPKSIENISESINDSVSGAFGAIIHKFNKLADDTEAGIFSNIGKLFGIREAESFKTTASVSGVGKKAIAWDAEAKQALTRVIPDTLAKILAVQTKSTEQFFDYASGQYVDVDVLADKYNGNNMRKEAAYSAMRDILEPVQNQLARIDFGDNVQLLKDIKQGMDELALSLFEGNTFNPKNFRKLSRDPDKEGKIAQSLGITVSDEVAQYIASAMSALANGGVDSPDANQFMKGIKNAQKERFRKNMSQKDLMDSIGTDPISVAANLFNNYARNKNAMYDSDMDLREGQKKSGKYTDEQKKRAKLLGPTRDAALASLQIQQDTYNLLERIYLEVADINRNGVGTIGGNGGGGGKRSGRRARIDARQNRQPITVPFEPGFRKDADIYNRSNDRGMMHDIDSRIENSYEKDLEAHNKTASRITKEEHSYLIDNTKINKAVQDSLAGGENMPGSFEDTSETHLLFNKLEGAMIASEKASNDERRLREVREKQRKQDELYEWTGIRIKDHENASFLQGLRELSNKPAQFLGNVLQKVDNRLYQILFGDEHDDKLSPKSFMNQLTTRMGYVFRNFTDVMKDEVFDPIKDAIFGNKNEEGILDKFSDGIKRSLGLDDDFEMDEAIAKFIFGDKDENGNRHGGMFGDKIQWTKDAMKDTYNDLFDYFIPPAEGEEEGSIDWKKYRADSYNKVNNTKNAKKREAIEVSDEEIIGDDKFEGIAKLLGGSLDDDSYRDSKKYEEFKKKFSEGDYGYLAEQDPELFSRITDREYAKSRLRRQGVYSTDELVELAGKNKEKYLEKQNQINENSKAIEDLNKKADALNVSTSDLTEQFYNNEITADDFSKGIEQLGAKAAEATAQINQLKESSKELQRQMNGLGKEVLNKAKSSSALNDDFRNRIREEHGVDIDKTLENARIAHNDKSGDYEKRDDIISLAKGGEVKKTGLVALSKGEFIIPNKYNTHYKGNKDTNYNLKKEQNAIDKYLRAGNVRLDKNGIPTTYKGIRQFAKGGYTGTGENPGEAEVVDYDIQEGDIDPKAYRNSKLSRLTDSISGKITEHSRNIRRDNKRKRNFKKLTPEQKKIIEDFGYDGDYETMSSAQQDMYDNGDFIGVLRSMGRLEEGIQAAADDMDADKYEENKEKLFNGMINDLKDNMGAYFPSALGSSLIGAGVSLVTGAVGGPLLGAAVGAGVDIAAHSDKVKDWLFGELDENGDRKGNIISADITNNVKKYFPTMAKGATVGAITSILPFVPGGPVSGIILGSALGFAKKNDTIQNFLFGHTDENGEFERGILPPDFKKKLQGVVPDAILGMMGGAAGTLLVGGPFGLVGNMALGGAVGILASMGTFQDALFGKKDPSTGIREGGLLGTIKTGFVDPMIETGKDLKDRFVEWFKKDIAHPLSEAIAPLAKQGGLFVNKIMSGVSSAVGGVVAHELGSSWAGLGHLFQSVTKKVAGGTVALGSAMAHPIGSAISAPARLIGNVGEHFKKNQVADGNADYMTAKQRLQYRQELDDGVYYKKYTKTEKDKDGNIIHRKGDVMVDDLGRPIKDKYNRRFRYFHNTLGRGKMNKHGKHADKFETFDRMISEMDVDQLDQLNKSLSYLKDPDKVSQRQRNSAVDAINNEVHYKYGFGYRQSQKLLNILKEKGMPAAVAYIQKQNLDSQSEQQLITFLQQKYSEYQMADYTIDQKQTMKNKAYKELDKMGLKGINQKNLDKYINYTQNEYKVRKEDPLSKLNDDNQKRHEEIVNYFKDTVDLLKAMADRGHKDVYLQNIAKRNKQFGERKIHQTFFGDVLGRNTGALWGPNYDSVPEYNEKTGKYDWYYVNKETGERYQVDDHGRRLDGEAPPADVKEYTKYSKYNPVSGALHKGADKIRNSAFYKFSSTKTGKMKKEYEAYKDEKFKKNTEKRDEKIFKPLCIQLLKKKGYKGKDAKDFVNKILKEHEELTTYEEVYEYIVNNEQGKVTEEKSTEINNSMKDRLYKGKLKNLGLNANRLHRLGRKNDYRFSYIDDNKEYQHLDAEGYYNDLISRHKDGINLDGKGKIVGEEQDVLNKRRTVFDLFGNPIKVIKSRDGRWIKDPSDSENKAAETAQNMLTGLGDRIGGMLTGIGSDLKDGFAHLFNIDTERDGWMRTLLKVGGGVLGVLTAASAIPAAKAWWDDSIKPQVKEWFSGQTGTLSKILSPIAPTMVRAAVGIDLAIRSIPTKIEQLGNKIGMFITNDLPAIWSQKILPFYSRGFEFIGTAASWITENVLKTAVNVLPRVITGAIKGAAKFFTKDIYDMIFNKGKRDTTSMSNQDSFSVNTKSVNTRISDLSFDMKNFSGATSLASSVFGQDVVDQVTQSELEKYYGRDIKGVDIGSYPESEQTPAEMNNKTAATGEGATNNSYDQSVDNLAAQTNKSASNIQSMYQAANNSVNNATSNSTISTATTDATTTTPTVSYQSGMATGSVVSGKKKNAYKKMGYSVSAKGSGLSRRYVGGDSGIYNETELGDPMSGYYDMDETYEYGTQMQNALASGQDNSNATLTSAITSISDDSNYSGFDLNDQSTVQKLLNLSVNSIKNTTDINGIPCYNASSMWSAGSSAGITLYKATYDPSTGLVYSQNGQFIPNAYYDPASGLITATPTTECVETYPNIVTDHYNAFVQAMANGAITYKDIAGDAYDSSQDPNYTPNTWVDENGNIKDTFETVKEDLGQTGGYIKKWTNSNTIGGRLFGVSSFSDDQLNPTGLARSAITGNTGVAGKFLRKLSTPAKSGPAIYRAYSHARAGVFKAPSAALNYTADHNLKSAGMNLAKNGTKVEQRITKNIGSRAVSDVMGAHNILAETGKKTFSEVTDKSVQGILKDSSKEVYENLSKKAGEYATRKSTRNTAQLVGNAFKESSEEYLSGGKFTKTLVSKLKSIINDILESKACAKIVSKFGKDGVEEALKEAAEKGSEDIAGLLLKKAGEGAVGRTIKGICHYIPLVNAVFWANDFIDGYRHSATYLGISEDQLKAIFPGYYVVIKIICGIANVLNGQFLLGIIPMTSIVDIFINYLAPVLGINTEKLQAARDEMTTTVDQFNKQHGTNFDENEYNKYMASTAGDNTSITGAIASILPWTETYKLKHQVEANQEKATEKNYTSTSTENAQKINDVFAKYDAVKAAMNNYNPTNNINSSSSSGVKMSDLRKKYNYGKGSMIDLGNNTVYIGGSSNPIHLSTTYQTMNYDTTANLAKAIAKGSNPMYKGVTGSGTRFVASGSGITNRGVRFISDKSFNSVSGGGSMLAPISHQFTSLGSMATISKAIGGSTAKYIGAGSGIAGRGSEARIGNSYTVYYTAGASKKKDKKKDTNKKKGGSDIISQAAIILLKYTTNGDIGYMASTDGSLYKVGCVCWTGDKAAQLLKKVSSKDPTSAKQIVGDKVYKKLAAGKSCTTSDYSASQVISIKKLLSTEESRQIQIDMLTTDLKNNIAAASKLYSDPKVVMYAAMIMELESDLNKQISKLSKDTGLDAFYKAFKSTKIYKTNTDVFDSMYNDCKSSNVTSVDTSKVDSNAIANSIGIDKKNTVEGSDSGSSGSSGGSDGGSGGSNDNESSGNWLTDLQSALSNMANAVFGIGRDKSGSSDGTGSDGSNVDEYGQEIDDQQKTAAELKEKLDAYVADMESYANTLKQRLNKLEAAYNVDPSTAIDKFSNSTLLELLLGSEWFQKWADKQDTSPIEGNDKEASKELENRFKVGANVQSATDNEVNNTDTADQSVSADIVSSANGDAKITYTTSDKKTKSLTTNDIFVSSVIKSKDTIAKKVTRDYAAITSGDTILDDIDNFKSAFMAFINTFACSSATAKKTRFYKEVLKNHKSLFKKIKAKWNDRVGEINYLLKYLNGTSIEADFDAKKFWSRKDILVGDLELSMQTLANSTDPSYAEQEEAWNTATASIQELLGLEGPLTTTTLTDQKNNDQKAISDDIPASVYEQQRMQQRTEDLEKNNPLVRFRKAFKKDKKSKKNKNPNVDIVKQIIRGYQKSGVHDFDAVIANRSGTDAMGLFEAESQVSSEPKEVIMARIAQSHGVPKSDNDYKDSYAQALKESNESITTGLKEANSLNKLKTYNLYNPYTVKRLIRDNKVNEFISTDQGKKYKSIADNVINSYIYNHNLKDLNKGDDRLDGANLSFGYFLGQKPKNDPGFKSFEDFYQSYRNTNKDKILNKQKYSSEYLGISGELQQYLPKLPHEIKINGKDIDNDSFVYSDALYQDFLLKDNDKGDIFKRIKLDSKYDEYKDKLKEDLDDSLKKYNEFEGRKLVAAYYNPTDIEAANKTSNARATNETNLSKIPDDGTKTILQRLLPVNKKYKTDDKKLNDIIKAHAYSGDNTLGTLYASENQKDLDSKLKQMTETLINKYTGNYLNTSTKDSFGNTKDASINDVKVMNADDNSDPGALGIRVRIKGGKVQIPKGTEYIDINNTSDLVNASIGTGYTDAQYLNAIKKYASDNGYSVNVDSNGSISLSANANTNNNTTKSEQSETDKAKELSRHGANGAGSRIQDMIAGSTNGFVSQLDYKNMKFNDGESMAEAGCGPAVAAMALNGLSGGASMADTAPLANKYKVNGGTDANYFRDIMGRNGVGTKYYEGSQAKTGITDTLKKGQQAVVLGQDSSNNSKSKSPFGPGNHYVLAKGMGGGKVAINDPEQHGTRVYNKNILNKAKLGIAIQGKGSGVISKANRFKSKFFGGASYSKSLKHANLGKWSSMTADELRKAVEGYHGVCKISKNAQVFLDAGKASGLDPRFLVALAAEETGWDSNANACGRANNVFDIAAYDSNPFNKDSTGTYGASNYKDGVCKGAVWIATKYYKAGQTTVYLMRHSPSGSHNYCTSDKWEDDIASIMARMPENTKVSFDSKSIKLDASGYTSTGGSDSGESGSDGSSSSGSWQEQLVSGINGMADAMMGNSDGSSSGSSNGSASTTSNGTWVSVVQATKEAMATASGTYSQGSSCNITVDGKSIKARTDCSGFVSACLKAFGSDIGTQTSASFTSGVKIPGFTKMSWPGWDKLVKGDIIALNGHVEIFSHNDGSGHKVWNYGSNKSAPVKGVTGSSHGSYTTVYRCNSNAGKGSGITLSNAIGSIKNKVTINKAAKGSGVNGTINSRTSRMSDRALNKISYTYGAGSKANTYSNRNINRVGNTIAGKSYSGGSSSTTFANVFSSINSAYSAKGAHSNETVTMFHPDTGAVIEVPYAAAGSAMDVGFVAGATKVKGAKSKKKVATGGTNLANTNMLIKTIIQLLTSINKSEKKNVEIANTLKKLYALQQQQGSSDSKSKKKKKKGKGSELVGGDSEMDESTTTTTNNTNSTPKSSYSVVDATADEDDSINGLINSLMKIIVD